MLSFFRWSLKRRRVLAEQLVELILLTRRLVVIRLLMPMRKLPLYRRVQVAVIPRLLTARLTTTSLLHLFDTEVRAMTLLVVVRTGALLGVEQLVLARSPPLLATGRMCTLNGEAVI